MEHCLNYALLYTGNHQMCDSNESETESMIYVLITKRS